MASISLKYKSKQGSLTAPGDVDPGAMIPIATTTLSTATATVTFSDIPQSYEHLQVRAIVRTTRTDSSGIDYVGIRINSDSGSNYAYHLLYGNGSSATAQSGTSSTTLYNGNAPRDGATASIYGVNVFDILDYTNTNKYKTIRTLGGSDTNGAGQITFSSGLWLSTSAVTSISFSPESNSWKQYSSFALYGIKRAGA